MSKIGYIRVSTEHQETARQQEIMCGYQVDRIFSEKLSGANTDRPQLRAMLDYVREGDTLYIESISRLGRSTKDLLHHRHPHRQRSYPYQPQGENRHQHACGQIYVDRVRCTLSVGA